MPKIIRILSKDLNLDNFIGNFLNIYVFHPQITDFQIIVSRPNIVLSKQTIHQWIADVLLMYTSQFQKVYPYGFVV